MIVSLPQGTPNQMHRTAAGFPGEVDEFDAVGLEKAPSLVLTPPRVHPDSETRIRNGHCRPRRLPPHQRSRSCPSTPTDTVKREGANVH